MLRNKLFCNTCETRSCFVIFLILILMITSFYWLLFIYLCESSYFVSMHFLFFCQVPSYSTPFYFIIFCSFLWNIHQKYLYLCEFAQCTLFLNLNVKHMMTVTFLRFLFSLWSCSSGFTCSYFILSQQSLEHITSRVCGASSE